MALNLPARERIELVVELWDSLEPGEIPVPDWQRDVIRDRLAALEDFPPEDRSVPWETVRKRPPPTGRDFCPSGSTDGLGPSRPVPCDSQSRRANAVVLVAPHQHPPVGHLLENELLAQVVVVADAPERSVLDVAEPGQGA